MFGRLKIRRGFAERERRNRLVSEDVKGNTGSRRGDLPANALHPRGLAALAQQLSATVIGCVDLFRPIAVFYRAILRRSARADRSAKARPERGRLRRLLDEFPLQARSRCTRRVQQGSSVGIKDGQAKMAALLSFLCPRPLHDAHECTILRDLLGLRARCLCRSPRGPSVLLTAPQTNRYLSDSTHRHARSADLHLPIDRAVARADPRRWPRPAKILGRAALCAPHYLLPRAIPGRVQ